VDGKLLIKSKEEAFLIQVPDLLISEALPQIEDVNELKVILYLFRAACKHGTCQRLITFREMLDDQLLAKCLIAGERNEGQVLSSALDLAVKHGVIVRAILEKKGTIDNAYLLSSEYEQVLTSRLKLNPVVVDSKSRYDAESENIKLAQVFRLYEQNIGILTPIIADELREAAKVYAIEWMESAFKEAVNLNKRNWKYILRILERWAVEGKDNGEFGRDIKKEDGTGKYVKGKYGHMVER
jgi:DNA replication protein